MSGPVIFILGAGPKIGQSVADAFAAKGYRVALAARSVENGLGDDGFLRIKLDLSDTTNIEGAFTTVTRELGIPSVVVYNGRVHTKDCVALTYTDRTSSCRESRS